MDRSFSVQEARQLMPDVLARASEVITVRADLIELQAALAAGKPSRLGGLPEAKGLQARFSELLAWFPRQGLEVKGLAPLLLDFPGRLAGEPELGWYHKPELGFAGRRRIPERAG